MNKLYKTKWLEALKSGKYAKIKGQLRKNKREMCCLGVLCDISELGKWCEGGYYNCEEEKSALDLPCSVMEITGINRKANNILSNLNDDNKGWDKVIEYIEKNL